MAWYEFDSKSGFYRIRFRYPPNGGAKFNLSKSLMIQDEDTANAKCVIVEETIRLLMRGTLEVPDGVDVGEFIVSGGTLKAPPAPVERTKTTTLKELFDAYVEEMAGVEGRESTLKTERYHIAHLSESGLRDKLKRGLGSGKVVASISFDDIQGYVTARSKQRWRDKTIGRDTIEKELGTLGTIWRWGMRRGMVGVAVPWRIKDLTLPFAKDG